MNAPPWAQIASCLAGHNPDDLPLDAARRFIAQLAPPALAVEMLPIRSTLGRVLALDLVSNIEVPACDNAAMDGYAFQSADLSAETDTVFRIAGASLAGQPFRVESMAGHCVRITTGAAMPAGLDSVVPQEFVTLDTAGNVNVPRGVVKAGANRRLAGEDLASGELALKAGRVLRPSDLGLAASLGRAELPVFRRLRVAFFSTGDELRSVGEELEEGAVYDSNRYTLWGMLQRLGVEVLDLGVVHDDHQALTDAFRNAAASADVVITSGGVSVGEADHTKRVMASLGEVLFWGLAMRPGRPLAIGRIAARAAQAGGAPEAQGAILFGLPGNPVAVMVSFYALVRDALLAMSGATLEPLLLLRATSTVAIAKKPGRSEYQRGLIRRQEDGSLAVRLTGAQGSGVLRSMSEANAFVVLHHDQGPVESGELVDVLPFSGLI